MRTSLHKREDRLVERLRDPEERRRGSDARAMSATSVVRGGGRNLLHESLRHHLRARRGRAQHTRLRGRVWRA